MKQPNYRFAVSDPRDVDFARIISEAGEQEIILLTGREQHEAYSTSLLMISSKFLNRFYRDDEIMLADIPLGPGWGYSYAATRAANGGIYFIEANGDSLCCGWRFLSLRQSALKTIEQEIAAAREFAEHNKRRISVRYL